VTAPRTDVRTAGGCTIRDCVKTIIPSTNTKSILWLNLQNLKYTQPPARGRLPERNDISDSSFCRTNLCAPSAGKTYEIRRISRKLCLFINTSLASGPCRTWRHEDLASHRSSRSERVYFLDVNHSTIIYYVHLYGYRRVVFTLSCTHRSPYPPVSSRLWKSHRYR